jgi:hypothetical protein
MMEEFGKCSICGSILLFDGKEITPDSIGLFTCPNLYDGEHSNTPLLYNLRKSEGESTFMTFQQFDKFQEDLLKEVVKMKDTKGKEYANSEDRFANFNRLAPRLGISNLAVCLVYLTKHMDAIESYCKTGKTHSTESIQGRIVDAITYLTLLAGMIDQKELNRP